MLIAFWRAFFLYVLVICCLRFMGKRQIGELQPSELVTTIIISNIAAIPIENMGTPLISSTVPIVLLACMEVLSSGVILKSRRARKIIMGSPRTVIQTGKIKEEELRKIRWSIDDLMEQLRANGIFDISEVDYGIVETNGKLSVYQKFEHRPLTNKDAGIKKQGFDSPAVILISDTEVLADGLHFCEVDDTWLANTLRREHLKQQEIFLMSCNKDKQYFIARKEKAK